MARKKKSIISKYLKSILNSKAFKYAKSVANDYIKDPDKLKELLKEAIRKLSKVLIEMKKEIKDSDALREMVDDIGTLIRLLKAWIKKEYKAPRKTIISVIVAIIYFVMPIDVVPDFIPVAGLLDDAAVIAFVMKLIKEDIEDFKEWENHNKGSDGDSDFEI